MNPLVAFNALREGTGGASRRGPGLLLGALLIAAGPLPAAPFLPTDPNQVLERLPLAAADPQLRELRDLRRQLADQPDDLERALRFARRHLEIGRAEADPRYYGYAQAALTRWWDQIDHRPRRCCCAPCCDKIATISTERWPTCGGCWRHGPAMPKPGSLRR